MGPEDLGPLKHLIDSNFAPSPNEYGIAERFVANLDTELASLDKKIAILQQELGQLAAKRSVINANRRRWAGVISARRRIPPEITQTIMDIIWQEKAPNGIIFPEYSPIPTLMLISREWYHIGRDTPYFWAGLHFDIMTSTPEGTKRVIEQAERWYARAHAHPLSLSVMLDDKGMGTQRFIKFVHQLAPRIGMLHAYVWLGHGAGQRSSFISLLHGFNPLATIVWPQLHTLSLDRQEKIVVQNETHDQGLYLKPSMRYPVLRKVLIPTSTIIFNMVFVPWGQLLSLTMGPICDTEDGLEYLNMLRECSGSLQDCYLHLQSRSYLAPPPQGTIAPIVFPNLLRLCIDSKTNIMDNAWILAYLCFPALRSITYHLPFTVSCPMNPIRALINLLRSSKSSGSLRYLELHDQRGGLTSPASGTMPALFEETTGLDRVRISGVDLECLEDLPRSVKQVVIDVTEKDLGGDGIKMCEVLSGVYRMRRLTKNPLEIRLEIPKGRTGGRIKTSLASLLDLGVIFSR